MANIKVHPVKNDDQCLICFATNYERPRQKGIAVIFNITFGSLVISLCRDCVRDLKRKL